MISRKMKNNIMTVLFAISLLAVIIVAVVGIKNEKELRDEAKNELSKSGYIDDEVYKLNERTLADFSDVIITQFSKESQFVVLSVDAAVDINLKQKGVFDVGAMNKTQKLTYKGTGRFYVDLSSDENITIALNEETKTITIAIPHTKLLPIEIDPEKFESEDAKRGFLAFGDLKFTPKEYNDLQTEVKGKLEKSIDTKDNRILADECAIEEMVKIYDPIIKAVDSSYSVNVEFFDEKGGIE